MVKEPVDGEGAGVIRLRSKRKATFDFDVHDDGDYVRYWSNNTAPYPDEEGGRFWDGAGLGGSSTIRAYRFDETNYRTVMKMYLPAVDTQQPHTFHETLYTESPDAPFQQVPWYDDDDPVGSDYGLYTPTIRSGLGFEFKVRFSDVSEPWEFVVGNIRPGQTFTNDNRAAYFGIFLNPADQTLYVKNDDDRLNELVNINRVMFPNLVRWENGIGIYTGKSKTDSGYEYQFLPTKTVVSDKWYNIKFWFGDLVHIEGLVYPNEWDAYETYLNVTDMETGITSSYGPFYTYVTTVTGDPTLENICARAFGFRLFGQFVYEAPVGTVNYGEQEVLIDEMSCWWDPAFDPGDGLLSPKEIGIWTSEEISFDSLRIVRDIVLDYELNGGQIDAELRIKVEENDFGNWFKWEINKPDLFIYCTAIQIRLRLIGTIVPYVSPSIDTFVLRYLPGESVFVYRDGLVGVMRDTLRSGYKGQGDIKRWSANEMRTKEEIRKTLQDLVWQRFLKGGEIYNISGKAHLSGLDLYGSDLNLGREGLSDDEYRNLILGEMIFKAGTPSSLVAWIKDLVGIEQGRGYFFGAYPKDGRADWYPYYSDVDGKMSFIEWWKSGWILGGLFKNYLTENPEESGLILGETDLDVYEFIVQLQGFEALPYKKTAISSYVEYGGRGFIQTGSPFVTRVYVYVEPKTVGSGPCTNILSAYFPYFPVQYNFTFVVGPGDETITFTDPLYSKYQGKRINGVEYYDGSTWTPLVEIFTGSPSPGEFKYNYTDPNVRLITLASPVIPAGHAWQSGDELEIAYEAYGVKEAGWQAVPLEKELPAGTILQIDVFDTPAGERSQLGGLLYAENSNGWIVVWHEELMVSREKVIELLDKYRTICTFPIVQYTEANI